MAHQAIHWKMRRLLCEKARTIGEKLDGHHQTRSEGRGH